jgi:hypothetical protein
MLGVEGFGFGAPNLTTKLLKVGLVKLSKGEFASSTIMSHKK